MFKRRDASSATSMNKRFCRSSDLRRARGWPLTVYHQASQITTGPPDEFVRKDTLQPERRRCTIVRIMRSSLLQPLLTPTKQKILAATILQPDKRWYFRELARHLHLRPSTIQRDLGAFAEARLLERQEDG